MEKGMEIIGKRKPFSFPVSEPWELGYSCPICSPPITIGTYIFNKNQSEKGKRKGREWK